MDITKSLHITFENGSNPYVRFNMHRDELKRERKKWEKSYIVTNEYEKDNIIYLTVKEKE
jgi:hypothetical protein